MTAQTLTGQREGAFREDAVAQLRALFSIPRLTSRATDDDQLLLYAAEAARVALAASSVSIERFERELGLLRTLVNVGDLGPEEVTFPVDETYPVHEYFNTTQLDRGGSGSITDRDREEDIRTDPGEVALLHRLDKQCSLEVPITIDGKVWGLLYATRVTGDATFVEGDLDFARSVAGQVGAAIGQGAHTRRLEALALLDPLTGLASRRAIDDCLDLAFDVYLRTGRVLTVVICDVNGLKRVNDEHGHEAGDRLLQRAGDLLTWAASELPGGLAGRLGGDEFCLVVPELPVAQVIGAVRRLCGQATTLPDGAGMACGIASTADPIGDVRTARDLVRLADDAQYRAKRAGAAVPVVAGRRLPEAVAQVLAAPAPGRAGLPDQRLLRRDSDIAHALLGDLLRRLDAARAGAGRGARGDRLALVAEGVARELGAAAWWVTSATTRHGAPRVVRSSGEGARAPGGADVLAASSGIGTETWTVHVLGRSPGRDLGPFEPTLRALVALAVGGAG